MSKRLSAKIGVYHDKKQNKEVGEYVQLGVILNGDNGEYMLLDPSISIAGCLAKQNILALNQGKLQRDSLMVGVYEENSNQGQQQGGFAQQGQSQGGYNQQNKR